MSAAIPLRVRAARALIRLCALLPLSVLQAGGRVLAVLMRAIDSREYRVTRRNVALCFGHLDQGQQQRFTRESLAHTMMGLSELPRVWGLPPARALAQIRSVQGLDLLQQALARGQGVIVAAPHLGQWELLNLYLGSLGPMALLYRQPQHRAWEPLLLGARGALGAIQIRADAAGVRELFRCLKRQMIVGILPDQRPKGGEGDIAPFFGLPCKSMTLLSRLAHKTGAPVVFGFAERLPQGEGFALHFLAAPSGIDAADTHVAVRALHEGLEDCVRIAPAQYQWSYKRFAMPDVKGPQMYPDCR